MCAFSLSAVFLMYCLALAEVKGPIYQKALAAFLFLYNILLCLAGLQL